MEENQGLDKIGLKNLAERLSQALTDSPCITKDVLKAIESGDWREIVDKYDVEITRTYQNFTDCLLIQNLIQTTVTPGKLPDWLKDMYEPLKGQWGPYVRVG